MTAPRTGFAMVDGILCLVIYGHPFNLVFVLAGVAFGVAALDVLLATLRGNDDR